MKQSLDIQLVESIGLLEKEGRVTGRVAREVKNRLEGGRLIQSDNLEDHMCAFFVPVHLESQSVFIGHHVKADMWIPPGGHIEPEEMLEDTVRREFEEELGVFLESEPITLFAVTVVDLEPKPGKKCKRHWDWWHMVSVPEKTEYDYDRREFFEATWLVLNEALEKMSDARPEFEDAMQRLREFV
jgi:8-oxo-dGTP pyrophosphatase MutT (NUDIX family)